MGNPIALDNSASKTSILLTGLCLILLILIIYHDAPNGTFHLDDFRNIVEHQPIWLSDLSFSSLIQAGTKAVLPNRPLPNITFALDWWRGNGQPRSFLQTNLLLHILSALAVFALLLTISRQLKGRLDQGDLLCILLAAALWALHPIQMQSVTYVVQRMASMATLFTVLSVCAYLQGRLASKRRILWFTLSFLSFICAATSKEIAWITPFLILLSEYGICRQQNPLIKHRWDLLLLSLPVLIACYVVVDIASETGPLFRYVETGFKSRSFSLHERLLTQPRVILFHLSQVFWPLPDRFSIEHAFPLSKGLLQPPSTLAAILFVFGWIIAGIYMLITPNKRLWGFCLLWFPATLVIESSIIPIEMVFEHRMYMPLVGLSGLLTLTLLSLRKKKAVFLIAITMATLFLILCIISTTERIPYWQSRLKLSEAALAHAPNSPRVLSTLAREYVQSGRLQEGKQAALRALQQDPNQAFALEALAVALMDYGDLKASEHYLMRAIAIEGPKDNLLNHLGEIKVKQGNYDKAVALFSQAITIRPWIPTYHWNIAVAYEKLHNCTLAKQHWERFLTLAIDDEEAQMVRGHLIETYQTASGKCAAKNSKQKK